MYNENNQLLGEYDSNGNIINEYIYLGLRPVAVKNNGNIYMIHTDYLGTPRYIMDNNSPSNLLWNWDNQDPFGTTLATGTIDFNLRFAGQYYDSESGLHYNMNRMYDPVSKRYMQSDPLGLVPDFNTYNYVGRNPMNNNDMLGLSPADVSKIANIFDSTDYQMTINGLRLSSPFWNNIYKKYGFSEEDKKLMDCGQQTYYMNQELMRHTKEFDDTWYFKEIYGMGHVWGAAVSSNPNDPILYYDPRADEFSLNTPCDACHGWLGGYYDGEAGAGNVNIINPYEHPLPHKN